jgi:flagellar hook-associated protein 2
MGTTPATFNGTSTYAADLQQAMNRAVTIASLPLGELNYNVSTLQGQASELSSFQSKFAAIQTAIQSLGAAVGGGGLAASASDSSIATATLDSSAAIAAGTYALNVISTGAPTTTLSNTGLPTVADPSSSSISSSNSFTLTVGGSTFTIRPVANTLNALAQAINTSGSGTNATIVNLGGPSAPDYRLSLQSTTLGNVDIQLNDGTQNLLGNLTTGSPAQYQVDGQPSTPISSSSDTVILAPGVTVDLLKAGQTSIAVAPNSSAAGQALASFAASYNAVVDELSANHGNSGGALTGQSILSWLQQSLRDIMGYSGGSGSVQNLTALGMSFDKTGHLSFDQAQFSSVSAAHAGDVAAFLGSVPGTGFLNSATNILNSLEDPTSGTFQSEGDTIQQQIHTDNLEITATQSRVTALQNQLAAQMSAADALIASLQSQVTYFTTLFADTQNAIKNG